jgi:prepilin-type N-terminal cleavage/methylation domain-containing protein
MGQSSRLTSAPRWCASTETRDEIGVRKAFNIATFWKKRNRACGFTLIELVIASLIGAMVITGAFVILLTFRQQARMAWAERRMDQYMYLATRYLTELFSSALEYDDLGVIQNNYAVWEVVRGDLTTSPIITERVRVSGSRTDGLLIDNLRFDPNFPPRPQTGSVSRGVPMWDRRDTFELLYLGFGNPEESLTDSTLVAVRESQNVITMRMRYRHRERPTLGFLFGQDYARTRVYHTSVFLRNKPLYDRQSHSGGAGSSPGRGGSGSLGWSLASGKTAEEYLTEKWEESQSRVRPVRLP